MNQSDLVRSFMMLPNPVELRDDWRLGAVGRLMCSGVRYGFISTGCPDSVWTSLWLTGVNSVIATGDA